MIGSSLPRRVRGAPRWGRATSPTVALAVCLVLVAGGSTLTVGCSAAPDIDSAAAERLYAPLLQEFADTTTGVTGASWTSTSASVPQGGEDGCTWFSETLKSGTDLSRPGQWNEVAAATAETLRRYGFEAATASELHGGYTGIEAEDSRGATLRIAAKGGTDLSISVPVKGIC